MVWEGSQRSTSEGVSELLGTSPSVVWDGSWDSIPRRVCVSSWDSLLVAGLCGCFFSQCLPVDEPGKPVLVSSLRVSHLVIAL